MARMELTNDQNHSSDSTHSEQEVIRYTKKLAQIFRLNEKNAEVYIMLLTNYLPVTSLTAVDCVSLFELKEIPRSDLPEVKVSP